MDYLKTTNLSVLNLLTNEYFKKRIIGEIKKLNESNLTLFFYLEEKFNYVVLKIIDKKIKIKNEFYIIYKGNYPFVAPTVYINEKLIDEITYLNNYSSKILKKIHGIDCLCCSSILCNNNWYPGLTIQDILNDIRKNRQYRQNIVYKIYINIIKNKYLIKDINLDDWLF